MGDHKCGEGLLAPSPFLWERQNETEKHGRAPPLGCNGGTVPFLLRRQNAQAVQIAMIRIDSKPPLQNREAYPGFLSTSTHMNQITSPMQ